MAVSIINIPGNQNVGASRESINSNFSALKNAVDALLGIVDTSFIGGRTITNEVSVASSSVVINGTGITMGSNKTINTNGSFTLNTGTNSTLNLPSSKIIISGTNQALDPSLNLEGVSKLKLQDQFIQTGAETFSTSKALLDTSKPIQIFTAATAATASLPAAGASNVGYKFTICRTVSALSTESLQITGALGGDVGLALEGESATFLCVETTAGSAWAWVRV